MRIVAVSGESGTGKTHLCRELGKRGIACIDTDDVAREAALGSGLGSGFDKKAYNARLMDRLSAYAATATKTTTSQKPTPTSTDLVVLAGLYRIPRALEASIVQRLALRPTSLSQSYRRYLLRNLDNIVGHAREIRAAIVETRRPKDIANVIGHGLVLNTDLLMTYEVYKEHAELAAQLYRERGYTPVTYAAALRRIESLAT